MDTIQRSQELYHRIPTAARQVFILVNPKAGRTSPMIRAEELKAVLERDGFSVRLLTDLDEGTQLARSAQAAGQLRALVGVGGDGTAAELTNRTEPGTPITLLPSGTANLISKYMKLPKNPRKLAEIIAEGSTLTLDAGRANGRLFLVMVSVGIDADIVRQVHSRREERYQKQAKKGAHISYMSYLRPIMNSIGTYRYPKIDLTAETVLQKESSSSETNVSQLHVSGRWMFVFNLPQYGWGLPLVPNCIGTDQKLDHCLFRRGRLLSALWEVFMAQCGSLHRFMPGTELGTAERYRLTSEQEAPYQLDGDPGGFLPLEVEIVPQRFTLIAPDKRIKKLLKI